MNCYMGFGDLGGAKMPNSMVDSPARGLTELGLMNYGPVNRYPVGTRIYQLDLTDDGRWSIKDVTDIACRGETGTTDQEASFDGKERNWRFKSLNLTATESENCGASGRICVTEVAVGGQRFEDVDSRDETAETHSDLPGFFDLKQDSVKRVYFDDDDNLTVQQCSLDH